MKRLLFVGAFVAAIVAVPARQSLADDHGWATAGKILAGFVAADLIHELVTADCAPAQVYYTPVYTPTYVPVYTPVYTPVYVPQPVVVPQYTYTYVVPAPVYPVYCPPVYRHTTVIWRHWGGGHRGYPQPRPHRW